MNPTERHWFSTIADRDAFIDARFPQRECLDTPGCYTLPDGSTLAVRLNEVSIFPPPSDIDALCVEYTRWNREQGLNLGSADEHYFDESLTEEQRLWLQDFGRRWEAAERRAA